MLSPGIRSPLQSRHDENRLARTRVPRQGTARGPDVVPDLECGSSCVGRSPDLRRHADSGPTRTPRTCVEFAAATDLRKWEAVIVDDASTDDTADFVRSSAARDARIRLIQADGGGSAAARRNRALLEAKGQILTYLDDDNLMGHGWLRHRGVVRVATARSTSSTGHNFGSRIGQFFGIAALCPSSSRMTNFDSRRATSSTWA